MRPTPEMGWDMQCRACGRAVPEGPYCANCGAAQKGAPAAAMARSRADSYAVHPTEHVTHLSVITTLFPHLGHQKAHEFRRALIVGLTVLLVLYVTGFVIAALIGAAFLVPVLYLIYLYEAQVYRDEPASVIGYTLGGGLILGVAITLITNFVLGPFSVGLVGRAGPAIDVGALLLIGVVIPVIQEALKPIPALLLRNHAAFNETVDGLAFGVAAGLGFALAQTLINFSGAITSLDVRTDPAIWIYPLISIAIIQPLLHGSTTGAITAGLWAMRSRPARGLPREAIVVAVVAHIAFSFGTQLVIGAGLGQPGWVLWQAIVVGGLLVYIRTLLHRLLEEAADMAVV